jgi:hypothetical protein
MAPTDRSMPPPVMTKVMPMLTTPMTDARRRIVSMLSMLAKRSPAVATPTMISSTRAMTKPRLRPAGLESTCASLDSEDVLPACSAATSTRCCSSGGGAAATGAGVFRSLTRHFLP